MDGKINFFITSQIISIFYRDNTILIDKWIIAHLSLILNCSTSKIFTLLENLNNCHDNFGNIKLQVIYICIGWNRLVFQNPNGCLLSHNGRVYQPLNHQPLPLHHANIRDHRLKWEDSLVDNSKVALKTEKKIDFMWLSEKLLPLFVLCFLNLI